MMVTGFRQKNGRLARAKFVLEMIETALGSDAARPNDVKQWGRRRAFIAGRPLSAEQLEQAEPT